MPDRLRLYRTKGWRKPDGSITVARPSRWGNPYTIAMYQIDYPGDPRAELPAWRRMAVSDFRGLVEGRWDKFDDTPAYPSLEVIRSELAGRDLCCWCPLDGPCHADVLLELANS